MDPREPVTYVPVRIPAFPSSGSGERFRLRFGEGTSMRANEIDMTRGPLSGQILRFTIPLILSRLLQMVCLLFTQSWPDAGVM